jgi:hypothetical protein
MSGWRTDTQIVTASGAQAPIPVFAPNSAANWTGGFLQPAILVLVSSGASLTYNIEVTGDIVLTNGYVPANGIWVPFTGMSGLTATAVGTLGASVQGIRLNVTAYGSGTVSFQFIQMIGRGN